MFSGKIEDYILFEDKEIIVCRKPAGIAVQNARIGAMDLESSLKNYLAIRAGDEGKMPYLAVTTGWTCRWKGFWYLQRRRRRRKD